MICFCKSFIGFLFLCEKVLMQLISFCLASFLSPSLILWILDSKSAIMCFIGIVLWGKGTPKFLPRLRVFATIEEESENKICFLDVLVNRDGENIKTNWYQKPTWPGRLLNFHSHHPLKYKINIIQCPDRIRGRDA